MFYLLKQKQSGFVWILPVSGAETSYNQTITLALLLPFFLGNKIIIVDCRKSLHLIQQRRTRK